MKLWLQHEVAAADPLVVDERADFEKLLSHGNLATDHPIKRAAVEKLLNSLWHHSRRVDVLDRLFPALLIGEPLFDEVAEMADRLDADRQLQEVEGHFAWE